MHWRHPCQANGPLSPGGQPCIRPNGRNSSPGIWPQAGEPGAAGGVRSFVSRLLPLSLSLAHCPSFLPLRKWKGGEILHLLKVKKVSSRQVHIRSSLRLVLTIVLHMEFCDKRKMIVWSASNCTLDFEIQGILKYSLRLSHAIQIVPIQDREWASEPIAEEYEITDPAIDRRKGRVGLNIRNTVPSFCLPLPPPPSLHSDGSDRACLRNLEMKVVVWMAWIALPNFLASTALKIPKASLCCGVYFMHSCLL